MATKLMNQFQISGYVAKVSTKDFKSSTLAEILLSVRHAIKKNDASEFVFVNNSSLISIKDGKSINYCFGIFHNAD